MAETRVWAELAAQGRFIKWLARATGIPVKRLYNLKSGRVIWWREDEVEACARALGVARDDIFPRGCLVDPRPACEGSPRAAGSEDVA